MFVSPHTMEQLYTFLNRSPHLTPPHLCFFVWRRTLSQEFFPGLSLFDANHKLLSTLLIPWMFTETRTCPISDVSSGVYSSYQSGVDTTETAPPPTQASLASLLHPPPFSVSKVLGLCELTPPSPSPWVQPEGTSNR